MNTDTPRTDEWETYCDECYYHLWRVRRKSERGFNDGYHVHNGEEARALVDLLNKQDSELNAVTDQRDYLWDRAKEILETVTYQRNKLAEAVVYALESMSDDDYGSRNVQGKARIVLKEALAAVEEKSHE